MATFLPVGVPGCLEDSHHRAAQQQGSASTDGKQTSALKEIGTIVILAWPGAVAVYHQFPLACMQNVYAAMKDLTVWAESLPDLN